MPRATVTLVVLLLTSALGCRNPFDNGRRVRLFIDSIEAPAEHSPTAPLTISVVVVSGGCVSFERLSADRSPGRLEITAYGRDGSGPLVDCTADIRHESKSHQASPPFTDPFTIVVRQPDGTELTHQIRIR